MMDGEKILTLKKLLHSARYISYATVNEDGSPHISPMFFMFDPGLKFLCWGTHPDAIHTINMLRSKLAMGVIIDNYDGKGHGLYFKLNNCRLAVNDELATTLAAHNIAREKIGKAPLIPGYYTSEGRQRMYLGDISEISTNLPERDSASLLIRENRVMVTKDRLLS